MRGCELIIHACVFTLLGSTGCAHSANSSFVEVVKTGTPEQVRRLLVAGADPNSRDAEGELVLVLATLAGRADVADILLKAGARPNLTSAKGHTALMFAPLAPANKVALTNLLLEAGADPNAPNSEGTTPLFLAVSESNAEILRAFLARGGNPDARNGSGMSPVSYANDPTVLQALLEAPVRTIPLPQLEREVRVDLDRFISVNADANRFAAASKSLARMTPDDLVLLSQLGAMRDYAGGIFGAALGSSPSDFWASANSRLTALVEGVSEMMQSAAARDLLPATVGTPMLKANFQLRRDITRIVTLVKQR